MTACGSAHEPSAKAVDLGGASAGVVLVQGLDASSQGCALLLLREGPRSHLPGQWVQGACALDWFNCSDQRLAAEEEEV